jgi:hypothetical protein
MKAKTDRTEFWTYLGIGICCFLILIGIGGCYRLGGSDKPLIEIHTK